MRLRSLQIKGFKSFANDTLLNFEEDVIGVVGPNGAGKSNIVDAIRWVLGEQKSKELRLESMSDVIFNGTKTRKEAGATQVTLTFDNTKNVLPTEYQSVSVSRLLYRSGESEYRLNNVTCRLKDIRSLFIDTGIGSNSYAIIALGMVDDILADKDNARRKMFEQASGISKYKTRKRETLNKLKNTTADLDRIEDLLFEIENNLKSLEKQAKRTKKYFEVKENYRDLSIEFALRSVSSLKHQYNLISKKLVENEEHYRNLEAELNKEEAHLEEIKAKNLNNEQNLSDSQKQLNELVSKIRSTENEKNLANQRLGFTKQEINKLGIEIERSQKSATIINDQMKSLEIRFQDEVQKSNQVSERVGSAQNEYQEIKSSYLKVRSEMDAYARKKEELQDRIFSLEKRIAVLENSINNLDSELKINAAKEKELIEIREKAAEEFTILEKEVEEKNEKFRLQESIIKTRKEEIESYEGELKTLKDELANYHRKQDAIQNEYDLVKSMVDSFEGFPASIKYLSTRWKKKVPILSDLLDVREEYKAAIEQFLEPYLNHYLVENLQEANQAIALLSKAQKGKASFFLIDRFLEKTNIQAQKIPEALPAMEVVKIDDKYQEVINTLLANVYIYQGNPQNIGHLQEYQGKIFLAHNGSFIKRDRSIQGGSIGLFEGKRIGRKKNLEKLEKQLKKYNKRITEVDQKITSKNKEIKYTKEKITNNDLELLRNELKIANEELLKNKLKLDNFNESTRNTLKKQEELRHRILSFTNQLNEDQNQLQKVKEALAGLSNGKLFTDQEINDLDFQVSEARERYNTLNIEQIKQQNLIASLQKDLDQNLSRLEELTQKVQEGKEQKGKNDRLVHELSDKINELANTLSAYYQERDEKRKDLNEVEKMYYNARNTINEKEDLVRQKNRQLNQQQIVINQMKDEFNDVKFKLTGVGERLKIEFDIKLNDIINNEVDDSIPYHDLEEKVERLRKRMANFGEINPMALTAFDEMKDRYDTITRQRQDIIEAKDSLLKTIKEIENTATKQFMEAFGKVRENFINVFRSLFTEDDTCDLILMDPSVPLESDIEIIAKPKGKKPKSLSQLSGGEKTLTATALLFALYLLKPAPFCIFDEVDAPLDDANIQKFNRIVKKFSGDSQFIIVTHNKSTMAAVDVLYGVYMQEQGVSAVTPVDFREYEHQPMMQVVNN